MAAPARAVNLLVLARDSRAGIHKIEAPPAKSFGIEAMLEGFSQKDLFDYWRGQVQLKNKRLLASEDHVPTFQLRHECTNYDELRRLPTVLALDELERCRIIAIIKYECTAQALQRRTGLLREAAERWEAISGEQQQKHNALLAFIAKLKEKLLQRDAYIQRLEARIKGLESRNAALDAEQEQSKAEIQVNKQLAALQRELDAERAHRQKLAKNNQSLGGRVAHTQRYKRQRDALQLEIIELKRLNAELLTQLEALRSSSQQLPLMPDSGAHG
jgi:hypothetical protein